MVGVHHRTMFCPGAVARKMKYTTSQTESWIDGHFYKVTFQNFGYVVSIRRSTDDMQSDQITVIPRNNDSEGSNVDNTKR